MSKNLKLWRESASLIIAAKSVFNPSKNFNYKVLCLKRSSQSGFMPDTYVFPGGNISKSDSSNEWLKLYEKFGYTANKLQELQPKENVPPILEQLEDGNLPKHLSLRICAIRETFEECGVLICRSGQVKYSKNTMWASYFGGSEVLKWQKRVHDDDNEFLKLCYEFDIYPDIWALKPWSNWVTPPVLPVRFDAMFFISTFHQMPDTHKEDIEIQDLKWATPDEYTNLSYDSNIMLPPPQFYELSKLRNFSNIEQLSEFVCERAKLGCERYFPHRISTDEGQYSILPGDDMYPGTIDKTNRDMPYFEELPKCSKMNRIFHKTAFSNKIITKNFVPKDGHIPPVTK